MRPRKATWLWTLGRLVLLASVAFVMGCSGIVAFQDKLIFFPRSYGSPYQPDDPWREQWTFETSQGRQHAYWAPARLAASELPDRVWVLSGGNGTLIRELDFLVQEAQTRNPRIAFLALEYPGYGENAGKPGHGAIREMSDAALRRLAEHLGLAPEELPGRVRLGCCGHSLGAAVALENAAQWGCRDVVAISPFTSLRDMARLRMGPLVAAFVRHPFDNRASLDRLAKAGARVRLHHGVRDDLIPVRMARELRDAHPGCATLVEASECGHNDILWERRRALADILAGTE